MTLVTQELDPRDGGLQACVLVSRDGAVVKRYACFRQWGTITHKGKRYVARRLHDEGVPDRFYIERD